MIPTISNYQGKPILYVDDKPLLLFGGEAHNSSASSLTYMEEQVWPNVRDLHLNCLIVPVSWEFLEPRPGEYDFTLPDGLISQARREGVKLVFLWFGLWKNGASTYVPAWIKRDRETYFLMRTRNGQAVDAISPLCQAGVDRDAAAFQALLGHLKETDTDHTVVMVQVENEMGLLGDCRDFGPQGERAYAGEIPQEMADLYQVSGTWAQAFGEAAPERFMVYHYAKAVEQIAAAGKTVYPLPLYVNAWLEQYPWTPGTYPCGGPIAKVMDQWKALAPSIDLFAPDIYVSDFVSVCREYAKDGNPLFIPEARPSMDSASNVFAAFGQLGALGFSPFAIESVGKNEKANLPAGLMEELNIMAEAFDHYRAGEYLGESYRLLQSIQELLLEYRMTPALQGFTRCERESGTLLFFDRYNLEIKYLPHRGESPKAGGLILQLSPEEFLLCGMNYSVKPLVKGDDPGWVDVVSITEGSYENGSWVPGRRLNGDEFHCALGPHPQMLRLVLSHRDR
ncbi:MAG: DUF5597 domain-containing protein [Acutalibacter sp.]|jgi:hypothetical protein